MHSLWARAFVCAFFYAACDPCSCLVGSSTAWGIAPSEHYGGVFHCAFMLDVGSLLAFFFARSSIPVPSSCPCCHGIPMTAFVHHGSNVDALMRTWDWWSGNQSLAHGTPCFALDSFSTTSSVGSPRNMTVNHTSLNSSLPELLCWVEPDAVGLQATIEIFSRPSQPLESATSGKITMHRNWDSIYLHQVYGARFICDFWSTACAR